MEEQQFFEEIRQQLLAQGAIDASVTASDIQETASDAIAKGCADLAEQVSSVQADFVIGMTEIYDASQGFTPGTAQAEICSQQEGVSR